MNFQSSDDEKKSTRSSGDEKKIIRSSLSTEGTDEPDILSDPKSVVINDVQLSEESTNPLKGRITFPLVATAGIAVFGSSFPHGWGTGVLNTPALLVKDFLNETFGAQFQIEPDAWTIDILWSLTVSLYLLGGCGGAFIVGYLADSFGRKRSLLMCHAFQYVAAVLFVFCNLARSFELLMLARFITGFACGAGTGLVPMFLTEIAPVNIRGAMGVLHQLGLCCGILVSQCMGLSEILGRESLWPILLALYIVPCTVSLLLLPWLPESPRYLLVNRNLEVEAVKALQIYRGQEDVTHFLNEIKMERIMAQKEPQWSFKQLLTSVDLRMPLLLVLGLSVAQQLSGANVVFYYSTDIFLSSGIPVGMVQYANIGAGFVNVLMTGISVPLMEKCGRRILLLSGMGVMIAATVGLTLALNLQTTFSWLSYLSVVCTILFVVGFALGLGSIPQFIGAELFKQGPRPPAMSLAGLLNWLCNFAVGITFPSMEEALGAYSFLVFTVVIVIFAFLFWWKLPETKNRSFEEIYRILGILPHEDNHTEDTEKSLAVKVPLLDNKMPANNLYSAETNGQKPIDVSPSRSHDVNNI